MRNDEMSREEAERWLAELMGSSLTQVGNASWSLPAIR